MHPETQIACRNDEFRELRETTSSLLLPFQGNPFLSLNHSSNLPRVWLREWCNFLSFRIGGSKVTVLLEQFFATIAGVHSVKVTGNDCMFAFDSGLAFHPVISWCCQNPWSCKRLCGRQGVKIVVIQLKRTILKQGWYF